MAAPPPWNLTRLQERAGLGLGARHALEAIDTPGKSPPPRPGASHCSPATSRGRRSEMPPPRPIRRKAGSGGGPCKSSDCPSLTAPVPLGPIPGANRDNSAPPQCLRPPAVTPRSSQIRQQGRQSAPDWQRWLGPGGATAARTVIPTEVVPRKAGSGNGGRQTRCLPGIIPVTGRLGQVSVYGWWAWPDRGGCCPRRCHGPTRQHRTIPDLGQPIEQLSHFQFRESGNDAGGGHGMRWEVFSSFPLRGRGDQAGISCGACGSDVPVPFSYLP